MSLDGEERELLNKNKVTERGLTVSLAAVFVVGTMCGSGILALPKAIVESGWSGIPLLVLCGILSAYTGTILGKCWEILRQRYSKYEQDHISDPYPTIGYHAAGKWGQYATRICIILTLIGSGTVFLLLIAENISNLVEKWMDKKFDTCYLILIVAACLIPLSWLGTPKDFWQAGVIAAVTTTIGAILIVAGLAEMAPNLPSSTHANPSFAGFFGSFGKILFAFGGASIFPTIQIDMKTPSKFPLAVAIGIIFVLILYVPVSVSGFILIGDKMTHSNILDELSSGWILYTVIILITSHLLMAFPIVINPVFQDLEGLFKIEDKFGWKRCIVRTHVIIGMLFLALSIPHFGVILSLVGGTTITATNFVFPPLFYLLLARQTSLSAPSRGDVVVEQDEEEDAGTSSDQEKQILNSYSPSTSSLSLHEVAWQQIVIPWHIKILLCEIIIIGVVGGISSTYSVIASLVNGSSGFTVPCYINWATANP